MTLGVAFGWHSLAWEDLLDLTRRAERLGFASVTVDGDVSMLGQRTDPDVLDGWTVTNALLARTERVPVASIRLVHHWSAAKLAQAVATAERIAPGRTRLFASIGERPEDVAFGLPDLPVADRIVWLDETLDAVRALLRDDHVTRDGRFVRLDRARVRPRVEVPVEIGARRPRLLRLVARHADVWNVNLPPIAEAVTRAAQQLADACAELGRSPAAIERSQWLFARAEPAGTEAALAEFRRLNPWFENLPDRQVRPALVLGSGAECAARLADLARELHIDRPILDLTGLDADTTRRQLESIPPGG